ncbi:hypothetical protein [Elizabethkingia anophelis]|uniref:hypothetical protein n=1 Tax=Elizabethkingia anophelis TaxID=1117645 RepID=UPI003891FBEC
MAKNITIGLAHIKLGAIGTDGAMGTTLSALGDTTKDTCKINFEDPEKKEFFVEEYDDPIHVEYTQGKINIVFQIANPDLDTVVKTFGGKVTGTGATAVYEAPDQYITIEQSMEVKPKKGLGFKFTRVSLAAKFTSDFGKENLFGIEVTATVMRPTKEGEPRFRMFNADAVTTP